MTRRHQDERNRDLVKWKFVLQNREPNKKATAYPIVAKYNGKPSSESELVFSIRLYSALGKRIDLQLLPITSSPDMGHTLCWLNSFLRMKDEAVRGCRVAVTALTDPHTPTSQALMWVANETFSETRLSRREVFGRSYRSLPHVSLPRTESHAMILKKGNRIARTNLYHYSSSSCLHCRSELQVLNLSSRKIGKRIGRA